jgi:hypothetical protein
VFNRPGHPGPIAAHLIDPLEIEDDVKLMSDPHVFDSQQEWLRVRRALNLNPWTKWG